MDRRVEQLHIHAHACLHKRTYTHICAHTSAQSACAQTAVEYEDGMGSASSKDSGLPLGLLSMRMEWARLTGLGAATGAVWPNVAIGVLPPGSFSGRSTVCCHWALALGVALAAPLAVALGCCTDCSTFRRNGGVPYRGVAWGGVVWRGVAWRGVACCAVQCRAVPCSAVQCSAVP